MATTYIIYSKSLDKFYIGSTRNDAYKRLYKHNNKHKGYTAAANDWEVVYEEKYDTYSEARKRESQIKNWKSRRNIIELISKNSNG